MAVTGSQYLGNDIVYREGIIRLVVSMWAMEWFTTSVSFVW